HAPTKNGATKGKPRRSGAHPCMRRFRETAPRGRFEEQGSHAKEAEAVELDVEPGQDLRRLQVHRAGHRLRRAGGGCESAEIVGLMAEIEITVLNTERDVVGNRVFGAPA